MVLIYGIYILFPFWLIHITRRIFYCVYFWQLKEYRLDRIKGDIKRSFNVFIPKTSILAAVVLLFFPVFWGAKSISPWNSLVLAIFCLFGFYSLFLLLKKRWKTPKFTKKAIFLLFLSAIALIYFLFIFIDRFFLFIVIAEITLPSASFLIAKILQIPTFFIKRIIYKKAKNKIEKLAGITVIGITGSYGKSSVKEFLYTILSKKYKVLRTTGNTNTEIGVAQTIINKLKPEHQIFIVEMAAYRKGEIKLLCDIAKPKIGVVTGVNEQHLALFGSFENLLSAEGGGELAEALPKNGSLIVNGDNKHCLELLKKSSNLPAEREKIYAISNKTVNADIWTENIIVNKNSVSFIAIDKTKEMANFDVKVLGKQNAQNLLAAILASKEFGMSFSESSIACKDIAQEQAGITLKNGKYGIYVVDSSYSSNPDGVLADLEYLSVFQGKKVVVMPCLIELGGKSGQIHNRIGKKIAKVCDLAIITSKDKFKELKDGAIESGMEKKNVVLCDKPEDIYSMITLLCKSGDAVLLEGRVPPGLLNMLIK